MATPKPNENSTIIQIVNRTNRQIMVDIAGEEWDSILGRFKPLVGYREVFANSEMTYVAPAQSTLVSIRLSETVNTGNVELSPSRPICGYDNPFWIMESPTLVQKSGHVMQIGIFEEKRKSRLKFGAPTKNTVNLPHRHHSIWILPQGRSSYSQGLAT